MDDVRPGRWYYALAALIFIVGEACFFIYIFSNLGSIGEGLTQVVVPGNSDLVLYETGKYTIFYEYQGAVNGTVYSADKNISGLRIELENKSTMLRLSLHSPQFSETYSVGGLSGRSIFEFDVVQPGVYELIGWYPNGNGPEVALAVGKGLLNNIMTTVAVGIGLSLGSGVLAIAVAGIVYVRRRDARRKIEEEAVAIRMKR
jgi:hypothetical protein